MKTKRNVFIDIIKGVAIFLMLWGHCIQYCVANSNVDFFENSVFKAIYSFHMPLFMLVSGYLFFYSFSKRDLKSLLIHKTQILLQPIVFCSIFNFFVTTVLFSVLNGSFSAAFGGKWLENITSLWFLWSVLIASLICAVVCKTCNNVWIQIALFFVAIPIVAMFPNANLNIYMYPYFVLGFYFAKYKDKLPNTIVTIKYVSLPLFPVLMLFYEKKHFIYTTGLFPHDNYSLTQMLFIDAYRWLIGLVGSIFAITILHIIYEHFTLKCNKPVVSTALAKLGKCSIKIYTFSVPFLSTYLSFLFPKMLSLLNINNIFVTNALVYNFVFTLSLALVYAFTLYYFVKIIDKTKLSKIMFGI